MIKPRIIVTGATGRTGSVVVSELLKAGYRVRAMAHQPLTCSIVTGRPAEDFETIARRYAALPRNQRPSATGFASSRNS
jgi:nucleoside-diphosphate-sugar epimerase